MFWIKIELLCLKNVSTILTTAPSDTLICKKKFINYKHLNYETVFNFPLLNKIKKTNYLRSKFKINKDKKIIIYQGVVEKGRGIDVLLDCVQNISS